MIFRKIRKAAFLIYTRPKGFTNYCLDILSALVKNKTALGMPVHITIEPTNICNLHCTVCETGSGTINRPQGKMGLGDFKHIIDKIHRHTNSIIFYFMGEPFLNPDSYEMIRYAKDKSIYISACTNGHFIHSGRLIDSGIDEINFQIGGVTTESHGRYRVGSNLGDITKNIKELIEKKKKLNKKHPKVILGFIVMKHNSHEIAEFHELADSLGVDETRLIEPCLRTIEQGRDLLPEDERYWFYDREAFGKGILRPKLRHRNRCNWLYFSTVILWNGDVVPCCRDVHGEYIMGNILKDNFLSIWNGKKYRGLRRTISREQEGLHLCRLCSDFGIPTLYKT